MTRFGLRHFLILGALVGGTVMGAAACAGNDSHSSGNGSLGKVSQAIETGVDGGATLALINEIVVNPDGTDAAGWEFVELRGTPGGSLAGFYLLGIDGDGGAAGNLNNLVDLSAYSFGSNGLLVIKAASGGHTVTAPTTEVIAASLGTLQNGSGTFMLVYSPTADAGGFTVDMDLDPTNSGTLTLPSGAIVVDSVGWTDNAADKVYGGVVIDMAGSAAPDAVVRFPGDDTENSLAAWYGGELVTVADTGPDGGGDPSSLTFSSVATNRTENFPVDGVVTPGLINIGTKGVDGGVDDADVGPPDGMADTTLPDAASEVAEDAVTPDDTAADAADADDTSTADAADADDAPTDTTPDDTATADAADAADTTTTDTATADTAAPEDTAVTEDTAAAPDTRPSTTDTGTTDTGPDVAPPVTTDDEGCGCRTPGSSNTSSGAAFAALALAGLVAARRRR